MAIPKAPLLTIGTSPIEKWCACAYVTAKLTYLWFTRTVHGLPVVYLKLPDTKQYYNNCELLLSSHSQYMPRWQMCTNELFLVFLSPETFMRSGRPQRNLSHAIQEFFWDIALGYTPLIFPRGLELARTFALDK